MLEALVLHYCITMESLQNLSMRTQLQVQSMHVLENGDIGYQ
jgi:hypothetical protein